MTKESKCYCLQLANTDATQHDLNETTAGGKLVTDVTVLYKEYQTRWLCPFEQMNEPFKFACQRPFPFSQFSHSLFLESQKNIEYPSYCNCH